MIFSHVLYQLSYLARAEEYRDPPVENQPGIAGVSPSKCDRDRLCRITLLPLTLLSITIESRHHCSPPDPPESGAYGQAESLFSCSTA